MAQQYFPGGQNHALSREIHGHIGWGLRDVKAFEVLPHGVSLIRQSSRSVGIRREPICGQLNASVATIMVTSPSTISTEAPVDAESCGDIGICLQRAAASA